MNRFLLVSDAESRVVTLLDAQTLEAVYTHEATGRVVVLGASAGKRYGFLVHRDDHVVSIVDPVARSVKVVPTGEQPTHFHTHGRDAVIFNDGSGSVSIFNEADIYAPLTVPATAPDHGSAVIDGGYLLAGHLRAGAVDIYKIGETDVLAHFDDCPVLHGAAQTESGALFGCTDGVMLIRRAGDTFTGVKILNPPDTPTRVRVGLFATHPSRDVALGNFGEGLAFIDPAAETMTALPLPGHPIQFAFDPSGEAALVLTAEGTLYRLALPSGEVTASVPVTAPVDPPRGPDGKPRPGMTVSEGYAYVASPAESALFEVSLDSFSVTRKVAIEGNPRAVVALNA